MPIYIFQHPRTKEVKEIVLSINSDKVYRENDVSWDRIFTIPNASIDTKIDPLSERQFIESTSKKRGKMGDLFDQSRELSEKRAAQCGHDPLKKDYYNRWATKRKKDHPDIRKANAKAIADKAGIELTD